MDYATLTLDVIIFIVTITYAVLILRGRIEFDIKNNSQQRIYLFLVFLLTSTYLMGDILECLGLIS